MEFDVIGVDTDYIATGRRVSLFADDMHDHSRDLFEAISGGRIAVIGAAGSIGSSVLKCLLTFRPRSLALLDLSENDLVEVVRDLRSSPNLSVPCDFEVLPIGLGSPECERFFAESSPFDYVLNLSAIKHVRSEKSIYSIIRMIDTNIMFLHRFIENLPYRCKKIFSVSSDKASNPANLMGATKMVMEKVLQLHSSNQPFSSARFANVAFSKGSLPHGFLNRLQHGQPIAAPNDVRRYFMSHEEAGQLCVLSCFLGNNAEIFFPKLDSGLNEVSFARIATDLLEALGYEPIHCASEDEARSRAGELIGSKKWPCVFAASNTTGEKDYEEFFTSTDEVNFADYRSIGVVKSKASTDDTDSLMRLLSFVDSARNDSKVAKSDYIRAFQAVVAGFKHEELGRNLDEKM